MAAPAREVRHLSLIGQHARLLITGDQATVEDLGSKNGTWVGRTRASGAIQVSDGDRLRLGSVSLVVRFMPTVPSTETVHAWSDPERLKEVSAAGS